MIAGETGKTGKALTLMRQAREIREALVRENPNDEAGLASLAQSHKSLGDLLVKNFTGSCTRPTPSLQHGKPTSEPSNCAVVCSLSSPKAGIPGGAWSGRTGLGEVYGKAGVLRRVPST